MIDCGVGQHAETFAKHRLKQRLSKNFFTTPGDMNKPVKLAQRLARSHCGPNFRSSEPEQKVT
jgi:hypothetical protein